MLRASDDAKYINRSVLTSRLGDFNAWVSFPGKYVSKNGYKMPISKNIFLLRKNRAGNESLVVKECDFPIRLNYSGKYYVVELTKSQKMIMKAE